MKARYLALIGAVALPACMPLEQAPLVYSSKQQMGVGVGVGESATPTLDVNIGYKGHDMALVPVFVSKLCPKTGDCKTSYDLQPIHGVNTVSSKSQREKEAIDRLVLAIAEKDSTLKTINSGIQATEANLALVQSAGDLANKKKAIEAIPVTAPVTTDGAGADAATAADGTTPVLRTAQQTAELDVIEAKLRKIAKLGSDGKLTSDIATLKEEKKSLSDRRLTEQEQLDRLQITKDDSADDRKIDALSVYGSFNGNASGGRDGAGLKLGKVFSTGVAAQNLSQGIGAGARASAAAECYRNAVEAIAARKPSDEKRDRMWDDALRQCGIRDW